MNEIPVLPFVPVDDPVLPLPSQEEMEEALRSHPQQFTEYLIDRQDRIAARDADPFKHGWEPAIWNVVDDLLCRGTKVVLVDPADGTPKEILGGSKVFVSGGNRSSKSEYAASRIVRTLVRKATARTWCFHTTGPTSISMQQPRVWKYLPLEWKQLRKHKVADIKYSQKNGFAGVSPTFVAPNGSQNWFKNYAQDLDTVEGEELDAVWMDELMPMAYIESVSFRLTTRNGLLILTFTAVKGYTATVKTLLIGATDVLRVPATLLPKHDAEGRQIGFEEVPRVQQGRDPDMKIIYFHIFDNVFGGIEEVVNTAKGIGKDAVLLRCYGVPTKQIGAQFPTFRQSVHVITKDQVEKLAGTGTNYHYVDPCSGRNWFHIWARLLPDERTILVYREWPTPGGYVAGIGDPGWWAEPDGEKHDGKRGPAQDPFGFGHERNIEETLGAEGWTPAEIAAAIEAEDCYTLPPAKNEPGRRVEEIFMRFIDSRFGNAPTVTRSETKTLVDSMAELGMRFEPAPGEHQKEGIEEINTLLYYNAEKEIGPDNKPRLVIAENCRNVIWALENWTGMDGAHGACKDPIDLLRYLALSDPTYVGEEAFLVRKGGSY
jgi:hypothetical protein